MTHYGLNPSFVYSSPLPLFENLVRRGRRIEADGSIRLMDAGARMPNLIQGGTVRQAPSGRLEFVPLPDTDETDWLAVLREGRGSSWHVPSLVAMHALRPKVLRTLDWQMTNKRPEWSKPRVRREDLLQGTDQGMAVELQASAANLLDCHLWWCAPPRFELSPIDYDLRLEEYLRAIKANVTRPPVLEYGNELWNAGFPVHRWLRDEGPSLGWHWAAANEIAALKRTADSVFGAAGPFGARPYYLFVGGQLTVPSHLDRILSELADRGVTPDCAGPALYVTPLKAHREEWEATGAVPTQDELRASCFARLAEIGLKSPDWGPLEKHDDIRRKHSVPYFCCYEAGQSLIAGSHPWRRAAIEAQKTEWMAELYRGIRAAAEGAGVDVLNWYSAATDQAPADPRVDVFGLLESTDLSKMLPKALAARGD